MHARFLLSLIAAAPILGQPTGAADWAGTAEFTANSLVLVSVRVNGREPSRFLVDTGATTTMLDDGLASELGLRPTSTIQIVTSAGTFNAPRAAIDELAVGTVRAERLHVSWMPLDELRRDDRRIAGLIGQDFLARSTLVIDYSRRRVELTSGSCPHDEANVDVTWAEGRPMIAAAIHAAGIPDEARLVLDSAANALLLFGSAQAHAPMMTSVGTHRAKLVAGVIPRVTVDVGGVRRTGPAVLLPRTATREETGLLPTAWFSRVCIDAPRSRATLSRVT